MFSSPDLDERHARTLEAIVSDPTYARAAVRAVRDEIDRGGPIAPWVSAIATRRDRGGISRAAAVYLLAYWFDGVLHDRAWSDPRGLAIQEEMRALDRAHPMEFEDEDEELSCEGGILGDEDGDRETDPEELAMLICGLPGGDELLQRMSLCRNQVAAELFQALGEHEMARMVVDDVRALVDLETAGQKELCGAG